jgi:hypothetical protein
MAGKVRDELGLDQAEIGDHAVEDARRDGRAGEAFGVGEAGERTDLALGLEPVGGGGELFVDLGHGGEAVGIAAGVVDHVPADAALEVLDDGDALGAGFAQRVFDHAAKARLAEARLVELGHRGLDDVLDVKPFRVVAQDLAHGPAGAVLEARVDGVDAGCQGGFEGALAGGGVRSCGLGGEAHRAERQGRELDVGGTEGAVAHEVVSEKCSGGAAGERGEGGALAVALGYVVELGERGGVDRDAVLLAVAAGAALELARQQDLGTGS